ncbi:hypothetical protein [Clostridium sp.]|uniref:hypothetical protein n=1 Tax=Clostridium sp. TaxID=1506 RepID=UPI0035202B00
MRAIEEIDLVKGSFNNGGQFQIILGTGIVDEVCKHFIRLSGISETSKEELKQVSSKKGNVMQRFLKALADVFVPILPALVAAGLLMGLNNLLNCTRIIYKRKVINRSLSYNFRISRNDKYIF